MFFIIFVAAVLLFSFVVMTLWNGILVSVLSIKAITFVQAMGILLLSKILFGGFRPGGPWRGRTEWRMRMQDKWANMTDEEREKFKSDWRSRCGWGQKSTSQEQPA